MNETVEQKTDRLLKLSRKIRSQLHKITSGLDATGEERLLEYLELREVSVELNGLLAECGEGKSENYEKAKRTVTEINTALQGLEFEALVKEILKENHFQIGINKILVPWLDNLQKEAFQNPEKPDNFDKAREIENEAVIFAKEVRKANRMISQLDTEADLQENKIFSKGLIDDQKLRFKHIAQAAATRVEQNRAIVLNWGFYIEMKTEADKIFDELNELYPDQTKDVKDETEDLDYSKALPFVLNKFLSCSELLLTNQPKPDSQENCCVVHEKLNKSRELASRGMKILTKIGECTEKTPAHQSVWDQTCRLKKVVTALNDKGLNMDKLMKKWDGMVKSQQTDDLDFQPLLAFMNQYVKCFS